MPLTVGNSDITDLHIVTAKPSSVTGRVIVDPAEIGALKGSAFRLTTYAANADEAVVNGGGNPMPVKDDFTFELRVRPGHVFIRSNTAAWFLRSVRVNGVNVLDTGFELHANTPVSVASRSS